MKRADDELRKVPSAEGGRVDADKVLGDTKDKKEAYDRAARLLLAATRPACKVASSASIYRCR